MIRKTKAVAGDTTTTQNKEKITQIYLQWWKLNQPNRRRRKFYYCQSYVVHKKSSQTESKRLGKRPYKI